MSIRNDNNRIHYYIGQRILKKRKELGYTGSQLAKLLNISQQQFSRYERGKNRINLLSLFKVAVVLKTPMNWFLEDINHQLALILNEESVNSRYNFLQVHDPAELAVDIKRL